MLLLACCFTLFQLFRALFCELPKPDISSETSSCSYPSLTILNSYECFGRVSVSTIPSAPSALPTLYSNPSQVIFNSQLQKKSRNTMLKHQWPQQLKKNYQFSKLKQKSSVKTIFSALQQAKADLANSSRFSKPKQIQQAQADLASQQHKMRWKTFTTPLQPTICAMHYICM